jgi:hypothetical protein
MIKKTAASFYMVINAFYITYIVSLMILTKQGIITGIYNPPIRVSASFGIMDNIIELILTTIIFVGLTGVLRKGNTIIYVILSLWIYFLNCLLFDILGGLAFFYKEIYYAFPFGFFKILNILILINLLVSAFVLKCRIIRRYYILFASSTIISVILLNTTGAIYDNFGFSWVLINPIILKLIPFVFPLAIFTKLYKIQEEEESITSIDNP